MDEQQDVKLDDSLLDEPFDNLSSKIHKSQMNDENMSDSKNDNEQSINDAAEGKSHDVESGSSDDDKSSIAQHPEPQAEIVLPISSGLPRVQRREDENREFSIILRTRGRAFSQALMTFAGTKQRSSRLWLTFGAMLIVIALLIIQVAYRHRELNLGYELSDAITQREALLEENRKLRIELRVLSRRERLEPLAGHQLGMTVVRPEQIFIVDTKGRMKTHDKSGKRADGLDNVRRIGEE